MMGSQLPLVDPRVYHIHVEYKGLRSDARKLALEAYSEGDALREVFVLKEPVSHVV